MDPWSMNGILLATRGFTALELLITSLEDHPQKCSFLIHTQYYLLDLNTLMLRNFCD